MVAPKADDLLREGAAIALAATSVLESALWRMPRYEVQPFHTELGELCDRLVDGAFSGADMQALVGAPPRHGKTELIAVAMPVRCLLRAWQARIPFAILYVTAKETLARRVCRVLRGVCEQLYQLTGDEYFAPAPDGEWTAESFETQGGFTFRSIGRGGATGGIGCNLLILDDLLGSDKSYRSAAEREEIWRAISADYQSRLMDGGSTIHMETRRGVLDTTARVLEERGEEWEHHVWRCYDPETDTYLWPRRMNAARRKKLDLHDSHRDWLSLYQQAPVPEGGTQIASDWLTATYTETPHGAAGRAERVVIGVDLAASKKTTADHCAFVVLGCRGAYRDVLHVEREQMDYPRQRQRLLDLVAEWRPNAVVVEAASNGHAMVADLEATVSGLRGESPRGQDKVARLAPHLPVIQAGQLRLPAVASWRRAYLAELVAFTGRTEGEADDQVDATVWALVAAHTPDALSASDWSGIASGMLG